MRLKRRIHPLLVLVLLFLLCAIGFAINELSGQANKEAADAGMASADMEMASLETITAPKETPPNVNWNEERRLRKELERLDSEYKGIASRAQQQSSSPNGVDDATASSLRASAGSFKSASDQYASVWEAGNCITRARLARETGASRVASAEVIIAGADSGKIDALNKQQAKLNDARKAYIKEAVENDEISAEDKAAMKANLMPKAYKLVSDTAGLVTRVAGLLNQIRSQVSPAGLIGGISGCATTAASSSASGGSAVDSAATQLLGPVTSLLSLTKNLASNASGLLDDISLLTD